MEIKNRVITGNNIEVLKGFEDNCIDSIVTDPPYEIGFMGRGWDSTGIAYSVELWKECLRVLKPGGHLLAFSGTRTYHRMAVAIEDAGFEIRDMINWTYGSGFPKSMDISKQIDKLDATEKRRERDLKFTSWLRATEITAKQVNEATNSNMGSHYLTDKEQPAVATRDMFEKIRPIINIEVPAWIEQMIDERTVESENFKKREVLGSKDTKDFSHHKGSMMSKETTDDNGTKTTNISITAPASPEAKQYSGYGTALKPAHEPIVVARKPISEKNIALNVLRWGTGGINIDDCRIGTEKVSAHHAPKGTFAGGEQNRGSDTNYYENEGRFPANFIISEDMKEELDNQSEVKKRGGHWAKTKVTGFGEFGNGTSEYQGVGEKDSGEYGASRYFYNVEEDELDNIVPFYYCPKAGKKERNAGCEDLGLKTKVFNGQSGSSSEDVKDVEKRFTTQAYNNHPTVKPIKLMAYLVRLVTPVGGTCLDPFAGSGSTLLACKKEGFNYVGIELMEEYVEIINKRLEAY